MRLGVWAPKLTIPKLGDRPQLWTVLPSVNIFIVYEINSWQFNVGNDFALGDSLFGSVKLSTDLDPDKYKHSGHCIAFDSRGSHFSC